MLCIFSKRKKKERKRKKREREREKGKIGGKNGGIEAKDTGRH